MIVKVPNAGENRENSKKKNPCQGIHREFCQNTGKTQGILFAQVIIYLILKVKDIAIFAEKISNHF